MGQVLQVFVVHPQIQLAAPQAIQRRRPAWDGFGIGISSSRAVAPPRETGVVDGWCQLECIHARAGPLAQVRPWREGSQSGVCPSRIAAPASGVR